MQIYLDECADDEDLVVILKQAGHQVYSPSTLAMKGRSDSEQLEFATERDWVLVTKNPADFITLHDEWMELGRQHSGILLIYQDNSRRKDMQPPDIARAVSNLIASGIPMRSEIHVLNHWR